MSSQGRRESICRSFHRLWPFAQRAQTIVNGNWSAVEEISKELIKNGRISGDDVEQIMSRHKGGEES
jgi:ATP-dependent Zn protease